jgi:hypothetical protein
MRSVHTVDVVEKPSEVLVTSIVAALTGWVVSAHSARNRSVSRPINTVMRFDSAGRAELARPLE